MSPLPLLKAMRPVRALLIAVFYTGVAWLQLRFALKQPAPQQALCTAGLILPFFWASLIAGGLHGVMHRSAFPLLPGAISRARALYLGLSFFGLVAGLLLALLIDPEAPVAGIAGLGALVSTVPLLNTRRRPLWRGLFNPWFPACFIVLGGLVSLFPAQLHYAVSTAPWLVLCAGLCLAGLIVHSAFSREKVRARQEVFFVSVLGTMDLRPHRMIANNLFYSKELVRSNTITLKAEQIKLHSRTELGEHAFWTERMQQVRFSGMGKPPKSPLRQMIILSFATFAPMLLVIAVISLLFHDLSLRAQAELIVAWTRFGDVGGKGGEHAAAGTAAFLLFALPFILPMVFYPMLRLRLRLWMPVPRRTQAKVIFNSALKLVLIYQPMVLLPIAFYSACALWLEVPLGFWVASTTLGTALIMLPLAPLTICASFLRSSLLRTLITALALTFAFITSAVLARLQANLFTPLIVLACLGATAAGFSLLKRTIDRRYLHGDLDGEMSNAV